MVIIESIFNSDTVKSVNKESAKGLRWFIVLFTLLFVVFGVLKILNKDYVMGVTFIVIGLLYYPLFKFILKIMVKRQANSIKVLSDDTLVRYEFYNDKMVVEQIRGEDFKDRLEMSYKYLFKVIESENNYLLYISNSQAHFVDKKDIKEGTKEELTKILSSNLGSKYMFKR